MSWEIDWADQIKAARAARKMGRKLREGKNISLNRYGRRRIALEPVPRLRREGLR